jgi:aspartate carbamoyltransferase regulatory subunit
MATIKLVELNNKSRKGIYVYIREKGKHGRYYKYRGMEGEIREYKKQFRSKAKGTKKRLTVQKYLKKTKRQIPIKASLNSGVTTAKIKDILKSSQRELHEKKKELIRPLIKDKKILNIMATEENFSKLRTRLEYSVIGTDEKGKKVFTANVWNKTPQEVQQMARKQLEGRTTKFEYWEKHPELTEWKNKRTYEGGRIKKLNVAVTFRKG